LGTDRKAGQAAARLPRSTARAGRRSDYPRAVPAPSQRRALGALFLLIAIAFAGVAWAGFAAGGGAIVVAVAAAALAVWMATMALSGFRR
jgi:hypothetical protein